MNRNRSLTTHVGALGLGLAVVVAFAPSAEANPGGMERCALIFDKAKDFHNTNPPGAKPRVALIAKLKKGAKAPKSIDKIVVKGAKGKVIFRNKNVKTSKSADGKSIYALLKPGSLRAFGALNSGKVSVVATNKGVSRKCGLLAGGRSGVAKSGVPTAIKSKPGVPEALKSSAGAPARALSVGKGLCPHCRVLSFLCVCQGASLPECNIYATANAVDCGAVQ